MATMDGKGSAFEGCISPRSKGLCDKWEFIIHGLLIFVQSFNPVIEPYLLELGRVGRYEGFSIIKPVLHGLPFWMMKTMCGWIIDWKICEDLLLYDTTRENRRFD